MEIMTKWELDSKIIFWFNSQPQWRPHMRFCTLLSKLIGEGIWR